MSKKACKECQDIFDNAPKTPGSLVPLKHSDCVPHLEMTPRPTEGKRDPLLELVDWETVARQLKQQNAKLLAALEEIANSPKDIPAKFAVNTAIDALKESRQEKLK